MRQALFVNVFRLRITLVPIRSRVGQPLQQKSRHFFTVVGKWESATSNRRPLYGRQRLPKRSFLALACETAAVMSARDLVNSWNRSPWVSYLTISGVSAGGFCGGLVAPNGVFPFAFSDRPLFLRIAWATEKFGGNVSQSNATCD